MLPGTVVTVDRTGLREHRYWTLQTRTHTDNQQTSIATVRSLLDDIVARQLVADVPRCVLLSGGLDSSVITALAAAQLGERGERVDSFAVDFVGQIETFTPDDMRATSDTSYAHDVATHVGSRHRDVVLDHTTLAGPHTQASDLLDTDLTAALDLPGYIRDRYASAVAEVEPAYGETEHERRMRVICHLHLTRFVQLLLDRKDRISMDVPEPALRQRPAAAGQGAARDRGPGVRAGQPPLGGRRRAAGPGDHAHRRPQRHRAGARSEHLARHLPPPAPTALTGVPQW
jgi:hypothetical protein